MTKKTILFYFFIIIIFIIIGSISLAESPEFQNYIVPEENREFLEADFHYNQNSKYSWPVFGYYSISSYFGKRNSPTAGASSYHSGIDIPAPTGTNIYSICSRNC